MPVRRPAAGQLPLAHQQFRRVVGRSAEAHALAGEFGHNRSQERVVFVVLAAGDEVRQKHADGPQVGHVPHDHPRHEEHGLVELAGHDHVGHCVPLKVADGGTELAESTELEIMADVGQIGIGVANNAQAEDIRPLPPQGLGDKQRIASPAGQHADAGRRGSGSGGHLHIKHEIRNTKSETNSKCQTAKTQTT